MAIPSPAMDDPHLGEIAVLVRTQGDAARGHEVLLRLQGGQDQVERPGIGCPGAPVGPFVDDVSNVEDAAAS